MRSNLHQLKTWRTDGNVNTVVEAPRGCGAKITYNAELDVFEYGKALPLGTTYPYCWGFIPGTKAEDGDPLDVLVLTDAPSYPGVVIAARLIGVLILDEQGKNNKRERNDRLVAVPADAPRIADGVHTVEDLPKRLRREIEEFFLDTTLFTHKDARCLGWKGPKAAEKLVRKAEVRAKERAD
jgi:inorganic pyrophosphatase